MNQVNRDLITAALRKRVAADEAKAAEEELHRQVRVAFKAGAEAFFSYDPSIRQCQEESIDEVYAKWIAKNYPQKEQLA
jgi:hypothetical protein